MGRASRSATNAGLAPCVQSWFHEVLAAPSSWRLLYVSDRPVEEAMPPAVPDEKAGNTRTASNAGSAETQNNQDIDIGAVARFRVAMNSLSTTPDAQVRFVANQLRRFAKVPAASKQLQVSAVALYSPGADVADGDGENCYSVEMDVVICRPSWCDASSPDAQGAPPYVLRTDSDGTWASEGVAGRGNDVLCLVPGTLHELSVRMPAEAAERFRALGKFALGESERTHYLLVALLPSKAAPRTLLELTDAALWLERLHIDPLALTEELRVSIGLPESTPQQSGLELRTFAGAAGTGEASIASRQTTTAVATWALTAPAPTCLFGSVGYDASGPAGSSRASGEEEPHSIIMLGRPRPCLIAAAPGPLSVLTALSSRFLRAKLAQASTPAPAILTDDSIWTNILGDGFALQEIFFCSARHEMRLKSAVVGADRPQSNQLRLASPPLLKGADKSQGVVADGVPVLQFPHCDLATIYRIECTRMLPAHTGGPVSSRSILLPTLRAPAAAEEGDTLEARLDCLPFGRYSFRVQPCDATEAGGFIGCPVPGSSSSSEGGYGSSAAPVLLPSRAAQDKVYSALQKCLEDSSLKSSGAWATSPRSASRYVPQMRQAYKATAEELDRLVQEGQLVALGHRGPQEAKLLNLASEKAHELKTQAQRLGKHVQKEVALRHLREQLQTRYRPGLEKALTEVQDADLGSDHEYPEISAAEDLLEQLRRSEKSQRRAAEAKQRGRERARQALLGAMHWRGYDEAYLDRVLHQAMKAGFADDDSLVLKAVKLRKRKQVLSKNSPRAIREAMEANDPLLVESRRSSSISSAAAQLVAAVSQNKERILQIMLDEKADPNTEDRRGTPAVIVAARSGSIGCLRLLIAAMAAPQCQDHHGNTPLLYAVMGGHADASRLLLQREADIGTENAEGRTALHEAAILGDFTLLHLLLGSGASTEAEDANGDTPVDLVTKHHAPDAHQAEILKMFEHSEEPPKEEAAPEDAAQEGRGRARPGIAATQEELEWFSLLGDISEFVTFDDVPADGKQAENAAGSLLAHGATQTLPGRLSRIGGHGTSLTSAKRGSASSRGVSSTLPEIIVEEGQPASATSSLSLSKGRRPSSERGPRRSATRFSLQLQ